VVVDGDELSLDEVSESDADQFRSGSGAIPVTYTRDTLVDMIGEQDVILPHEAIDALYDGLDDATVFGIEDVESIDEIDMVVDDYIYEQQEDDVLTAMLDDHKPSEADVEAYVEDLYAWGTDQSDEDVDPFDLKHFETEYLGFDDDDYDGLEPSVSVDEFRHDEIINSLSTWLYEHAESEDVDVTDYPFSEMPMFDELLNDHSWEDARAAYPDLDLDQWANPLDGTETAEVKSETIDRMVDMYDYSEASAERTTDHVVANVGGMLGEKELESVIETIKNKYKKSDGGDD
jgi:hypothetical protein